MLTFTSGLVKAQNLHTVFGLNLLSTSHYTSVDSLILIFNIKKETKSLLF